MTVQALKDKIDGKTDKLKDVKFGKITNHYSGDLVSIAKLFEYES